MAGEQRSFEEVLKDAPLAPSAETVQLTGALSRSAEAGKFVLTLADGRQLTIEVAAVKGHRLLGSAMGQPIVQVDLDAKRIPSEVTRQMAPGTTAMAPEAWKLPWFDRGKQPWWDVKILWSDKNPAFDTVREVDVAGPGPVGPGGDPWAGLAGGSAMAPFALATPHQAPTSLIAAMQGPGAAAGMLATIRAFDIGTGWADWTTWIDAPGWKRPPEDSTTPRPPYD